MHDWLTFETEDPNIFQNLMYLRHQVIKKNLFHKVHYVVHFADGYARDAESCYLRPDGFFEYDGWRTEKDKIVSVDFWYLD